MKICSHRPIFTNWKSRSVERVYNHYIYEHWKFWKGAYAWKFRKHYILYTIYNLRTQIYIFTEGKNICTKIKLLSNIMQLTFNTLNAMQNIN